MKIARPAILALLPLLSGCLYYYPSAVSTNPVGSQYERPVDVVSGKSSRYYLFGLPISGDDSLQAAVEDALSFRRASSLSNVFVDRRMICFPLCAAPAFTRVDTMVYGTLVAYSGDSYLGAGKMSATDAMQMSEDEIIRNILSLWGDGKTETLERFLASVDRERMKKALGTLQAKQPHDPLVAWLAEHGYLKG